MITRADKSRNTYKRVCMDFASDPRLSWEARGVMSYLLSKPDDWQIVPANLINQTNAGRDKVYRILSELQDAGYLEKITDRDKHGKVQSVTYQLTEKPEVDCIRSESERAQLPALPFTAEPFPANPTLLKEEIYIRESDVAPALIAPDAAAAFETYEYRPNTDQIALELGLTDNSPTSPARSAEHPHPPVAVPPPPPAKPARKPRVEKPRHPDLEAALWEVTQATRIHPYTMAVPEKARWLATHVQATPEQVRAFGRWFAKHSVPAQIAAKERRPVGEPTLKQITADWMRFLPWWEAEQARLEREAAAEAEERERREVIRQRDEKRRAYLAASGGDYGYGSSAPRPAMVAMGRRS